MNNQKFKTKPLLVMTLLVRNEQDIVRYNIDFHLSKGVDFIIATDNASDDGTRDILKEFEKKGVLLLIDEKEHNYAQADWVNRMGNIAYDKYKADYIFHCDADEFWFPRSGSLKNEISKGTADILNVHVTNVLLMDKKGKEKFPQDAKYAVVNPILTNDFEIDTADNNLYLFEYPSKVIFNTHKRFLKVSEGNHTIANKRSGIIDKTSQDITIYHYPLRNMEHFINKVVLSGKAFERNKSIDNKMGIQVWRWYNSYQKGLLDEEYKNLLLHKTEIDKLKIEGLIEEIDFNALILGHTVDGNQWNFYNRQLEYNKFVDLSYKEGHGHLPFLYDLVRNVKPLKIVELKAHNGSSFFSFCQAVKDGHINSELFAVDTWEDNKKTKPQSTPVWDSINNIKMTFYEYLPITLLKKPFDEAIDEFESESIDILHINKDFSDQSVAFDLKPWIEKVKKDGIILFSGITEKCSIDEVYQVWDELRKENTSFEFNHSNGLGIVFKGRCLFEEVFDHPQLLRHCYEITAYNKLEKTNRIIDSQQNEIIRFEKLLAKKNEQIKAINASKSWKITLPLRFISAKLKSLKK